MNPRQFLNITGRGLTIGAGLATLGYAGLVAYHRARYGRARLRQDRSPLLDRFLPAPEVLEHHCVRIAAPADIVIATAKDMALLDSPIIRAVFRLRELALGGVPDQRRHPSALLPQMLSIGWVVLAERAGREIVLGAVTRPWETAPTFRSVPAAEFAHFHEPGYVKIAWTLRAEPTGANDSMFHTETRCVTTDADTQQRFRRYWSFVAPGVELIRLAILRPLKKAAERRVAGSIPASMPAARGRTT